MKEKVFITGHRNPDSDSICASIAYAELKNKSGIYDAIPIRLGELNRESSFILDYFEVDSPIFMDTMKPTVADLKIDPPCSVSDSISLHQALEILRKTKLNNISVIDSEEQLIGIVSLSNITNSYMEVWDNGIIGRAGTPIENIVEVLAGKIHVKSKNPRPMTGNMSVYAMSPENIGDQINENDIVIIGGREDALSDSISKNVSLIILSGGCSITEELKEVAAKNNVTVISTEYNTFMTARLLPQSIPVKHIMTDSDLVFFRLNDYVEDIKPLMAKTRFRSYPVVDSQNIVVGSVARFHLISNQKKKLILVDHNERNQSIPDIDSAEIIEIIDHHRIANISTESPVYFRNEPLGSSCTIIAKMYFEQGVIPSKKIAGLLLSAIISDTLLFKSPTATDTDRMILDRLAKIANVNVEEFAIKMFKAGTSLENKKPSDLLNIDVKKFNIVNQDVRVAQIFTMDLENLDAIRNPLIESMKEIQETQKDDIFLAVLTDILKEESEIIVVGKHADIIAEEFSSKLIDSCFKAKGVLSRKKQVIPTLTAALAKLEN